MAVETTEYGNDQLWGQDHHDLRSDFYSLPPLESFAIRTYELC